MEIRVRADDLVSVATAANELGHPRITIYRWVEKGKLIGIKLGGILFIPKSEIDRIKKTKGDDHD